MVNVEPQDSIFAYIFANIDFIKNNIDTVNVEN